MRRAARDAQAKAFKQKRGKKPRTISIQIYIARNDCAEVTQARG